MSGRTDLADIREKPDIGVIPPSPGETRREPTRRRFVMGIYDVIAFAVVALMIVLVVVPIGRMFVRAFYSNGQFSLDGFGVLSEPWLPGVLIDTTIAVGASTVFALVIGAGMAWLNERTDANLGIWGFILPIIPMLMPSVALAIGWTFIGAPRVGFLNGILAGLPLIGRDGLGASVNIYSWGGLIWIYTLNAVPYSYLIVSASLRNMNSQLEEASRISGAGLWMTFYRVSLPAIKPALVASSLLIVISGLAIFSIPVIIATSAGIDILPVRIIRLLTNEYPPRMGHAVVLSLFMLAVVGGVWMLQRRVTSSGHFMMLGGRATAGSRIPLGLWRQPLRILMVGYLACTSIVPLIALAIVAFQPFWTPNVDIWQFTLHNFNEVLFVNRLTGRAFQNSLFLSVAGATIAMVVSAIVAIYVARNAGILARLSDGLIKAPAAVSNLIIAVGFLVTFSGAPFYLTGTLLLLLMAFVVVHIPPGSIAANAAVSQIGRDMSEASSISGAGEGMTVRRIIVPLALPGLAAGWAMVFVNLMGDLSASALLAGVRNPVIGFVILEIWETSSFGLLAAFATLMCLVVTVVVGLLIWLVAMRGGARRMG